MKTNIRGGILMLTFILFMGCSAGMTLTNFQSGEVLKGKFNQWDRSVTVEMPNGEILSGKYSDVNNSSMTFGSAFAYSGSSSATVFGTGYTVGGSGNAYALISSKTSKLLMEIIVSNNDLSGHGFGDARTNDGRSFKVQY
jgi:hypothetical protein